MIFIHIGMKRYMKPNNNERNQKKYKEKGIIRVSKEIITAEYAPYASKN